MRIGIDTRLVHYQRTGGIAQYTLRLLHALLALQADSSLTAQLALSKDAVEFVVLHHRNDAVASIVSPAQHHHIRAQRLFTPSHHRYEQWTLPLELMGKGIDVLHSPDFIPPMRRRCASVITVHDLAFLLSPQLLTTESQAYYGQINQAVQSAEQIIAVSHATRDDLVRLLPVNADKITVIHEAAADLFRPATAASLSQHTLTKFQLTQPFALFVGTIEPRKNLQTLLRAFAQIADGRWQMAGEKNLQSTIYNLQLVIAGKRGWLSDDIDALVNELRLNEQVRFLGAVASEDLVGLYQAARVFVLPSLYEGFGIPIVEAMACGTPVIVSNVSSLPEVAGDAGLLFNPHEPRELAAALRRVFEDDALHAELQAKSLRRAQMFSWQRAAEETLQVYQKAFQLRRKHL
jgi:glycosyltransferase involved in cell wall biosynthesis